MGACNNREAVVDPNGLVHGISKLRIIDASTDACGNRKYKQSHHNDCRKLSDSVLGNHLLIE